MCVCVCVCFVQAVRSERHAAAPDPGGGRGEGARGDADGEGHHLPGCPRGGGISQHPQGLCVNVLQILKTLLTAVFNVAV